VLSDPAADNSPISVPVTVVSTLPPLPLPWADQDIGGPGTAGSAGYASSTSTFTVLGAGTDIGGTSDQFHYVYQPLTGDGQIVARVASLQSSDAWAKAGVMLRETLDAGAANVMVALTGGNGVYAQRRSSPAGSSSLTQGPAAGPPVWVK